MTKPILLWLDDYRNPRDKEIDWMVFSPIGRDVTVVWAESYTDFIEYILCYDLPAAISFDYELGIKETGYDCAKWLVNYCVNHNKPLPIWSIHSADPMGRSNIDNFLWNHKNSA
jgi:hypothetical protein